MAFKIDSFIGNLSKYGTLQTNRFEVDIPFPRIFSSGSVPTGIPPTDLLHMRAESVRIPGLLIDSIGAKRYGIGPEYFTATNVRFDAVSITFIETYDSKIKKIFYDWSRIGIFNFAGSNNQAPDFLTEYKDNYCTDISIRVYNNSGKNPSDPRASEPKPINVIKLVRAFPISISDVDLSWDTNNTLYKFSVSFKYEYYQHEV
jgi:hypothetical protein